MCGGKADVYRDVCPAHRDEIRATPSSAPKGEKEMTFKIEKNAKRPDARPRNRFPFDEMEVGDSFFISDASTKLSCTSAASWYGTRHGKKFSVLRSDDGWRCWRTE